MSKNSGAETYVITFCVKACMVERFHSLLHPVLDSMREEKTFVHAALHADPERDNIFHLHETWTDRDDVMNVQLHRPYRADWDAALDDLLERPREIRILKLIRMDMAGEC